MKIMRPLTSMRLFRSSCMPRVATRRTNCADGAARTPEYDIAPWPKAAQDPERCVVDQCEVAPPERPVLDAPGFAPARHQPGLDPVPACKLDDPLAVDYSVDFRQHAAFEQRPFLPELPEKAVHAARAEKFIGHILIITC